MIFPILVQISIWTATGQFIKTNWAKLINVLNIYEQVLGQIKTINKALKNTYTIEDTI